ncbi:MAG TPA: molecular chaperone TorD family protein [Thermoanaerobaculia bacterium]|nr:molecular chaperone TorD family protein [Thermoanaerobaculia bacterium]
MSLAPLFRYPEAPLTIEGEDLAAFAKEMAALDLAGQQATYTATFDLAPSCSPYLGIHLFGEENRDRARLMVGLKLAYKRLGIDSRIDSNGELPDHVAEVLAFAEVDEAEEREELRRFVLLPALTKMNAILAPTANPYRHLVATALRQAAAGGAS